VSSKPAWPPKKKIAPDRLPGKFEQRVFIGGNYSSAPAKLRDIRRWVEEAGEFYGIFPLDDLDLLKTEIHDWDLRTLHQCKYAVFEVTIPGGELMEIQRARDYKTLTLLLWEARGPTEAYPQQVTTMLLQSGSHQLAPCLEFAKDAPEKIKRFLLQKDPLMFEQAEAMHGYRFQKVASHWDIALNGDGLHRREYDRLTFLNGRAISPITTSFSASGDIKYVNPKLPANVAWVPQKQANNEVEGIVVVNSSDLTLLEQTGISYSFEAMWKKTFYMNKSEIPKTQDELLEAGLDYVSFLVFHPMEELVLSVKFPQPFDPVETKIKPQRAAYHSGMMDDRALRLPLDTFEVRNSVARLRVVRPLILREYRIYWEVP
jgi:hypothetical protein